MSYVGYIPFVKSFLASCIDQGRRPAVLEVGLDRGVTFVPIVAFLARTGRPFVAASIDVKVQEQVTLVLANLDVGPEQAVVCIEGNSLDVLPKLVDAGAVFDVVLIDGDHNYHTVSRELAVVKSLVHSGSIVVCDDYNGRWAEDDLWYSERPGYENVSLATPRVETGKRGVKAAVDDWLVVHPEWQKHQPLAGEPVVLGRTLTP